MHNGLQRLVQTRVRLNQNTPDLSSMQFMYDYVPIFVWGTEKRGFFEHGQMNPAQLMGYGYTAPVFKLRVQKRTNFPLAFYEPTETDSCRIQGEVYVAPVDTLAKLDRLYNHGIFARRIQRYISWYPKEDIAKDRRERKECMSNCWTYQAIPDTIGSLQDFREAFLIPSSELGNYYVWRQVDNDGRRPQQCM